MTDQCHHEWVTDLALCEKSPTNICSQCGQTCPSCNVCGGPTASSLLACQRCLDSLDAVLVGITEALSHWQQEPSSTVRAIRYDSDRRGGNVDHVPLKMGDGPSEIRAVLADWVAMWSELSGSRDAAVDDVDYLRGRHLWAAHNADLAAWDDYRREMRHLRHRARRVAGLLPQRQAGACIYCGGDVVRDWADEHWRPRADGLSDDLRCTSCRIQWEDVQHWRYANRHTILALPDTHPGLLVTAEAARTIFPEVPAATWRSWAHRDAPRAEARRRHAEYVEGGRIGPEPEPEQMAVRSWDRRGRPLYLLSDLTALVVARADDTRAGRKAC